jgi:phosphatidate cytidylyltransferase
MKTRLLTAAVALPVIIASIILPLWYPYTVWIFVAIAIFGLASGLFEYFSLTKKLGLKADAGIGYLASGLLFVGFLFDAPTEAPSFLLASIAFVVGLVLITQAFRFRADFSKMLTGAGVTLLGVFFVAFLGGFLVSLRMGYDTPIGLSSHLLAYFFLVTFGSDAGAYFTGKAIGRRKLAPSISPGKTVEGLIGGLIAAGAFAALSTWWFFPHLPYKFSIPLALVIAALGVLGDLVESAIKRGSGAKDAAAILPGHGGLLDRLDSLLFGAPVLYYFARIYFG